MATYVKKNNTVTQSMSQIKATHLQSSLISFSELLDPPLEQLSFTLPSCSTSSS